MGHSRWTLTLCAVACLAAGVLPMLDAFGFFPGSDSRMNAPRWVIFIVAGLFLAAGVYLFLLAAVGEARARAYGTALGLAIFSGSPPSRTGLRSAKATAATAAEAFPLSGSALRAACRNTSVASRSATGLC
jgi:hypothetical protein